MARKCKLVCLSIEEIFAGKTLLIDCPLSPLKGKKGYKLGTERFVVSCSLGRLLCLFDQPEKMPLANALAYFFQPSVMDKDL
jgi:hypothetical protein